MMTVPEILKELEPYTGRFPRAAMEAAIEQREAITPELLRVVETAAADPVEYANRKDHLLHIFALFLLAQFRETRAYEPIVSMFSAPGETSYQLADDTLTEGLNRIFASVYNGNPAPLQRLIENEQADEYVRGAALEALVALAHTGQMTRDEVVEYFRALFREKRPRVGSHVWNALVWAVPELPAPELLEDVRQAFNEGLVDPVYGDLEEVERNLAPELPGLHEPFTLITNAIAEMEWWAAFDPGAGLAAYDVLQPDKWPEELEPPWLDPVTEVVPQPVRREPKIGRNEPCPCGSGKKYKKCCGKS